MAEVVELEAVEPEFDAAMATAAGAEQLVATVAAAAGDTTLKELELVQVEQVKQLLTSLVILPPLLILAVVLPYSNSSTTVPNSPGLSLYLCSPLFYPNHP